MCLEAPRTTPTRVLTLLVMIGVALCFAYAVLLRLFLGSWQEGASFGESFGAINALFSGLALAGVIYTVFLQREELALQRHELTLTREELRRSAVAQEKSEKALERQAEAAFVTARLNTVNNLLGVYRDRVNQSEPKIAIQYVAKIELLTRQLEAMMTFNIQGSDEGTTENP